MRYWILCLLIFCSIFAMLNCTSMKTCGVSKHTSLRQVLIICNYAKKDAYFWIDENPYYADNIELTLMSSQEVIECKTYFLGDYDGIIFTSLCEDYNCWENTDYYLLPWLTQYVKEGGNLIGFWNAIPQKTNKNLQDAFNVAIISGDNIKPYEIEDYYDGKIFAPFLSDLQLGSDVAQINKKKVLLSIPIQFSTPQAKYKYNDNKKISIYGKLEKGYFLFLPEIDISVFVQKGKDEILDPKKWEGYHYKGLFIDRFINQKDNQKIFRRLIAFVVNDLKYTDKPRDPKGNKNPDFPSDSLK